MSDSEKLDEISKRLKRVEINSHIHLIVIVLGFIGIVSVKELIKKAKLR